MDSLNGKQFEDISEYLTKSYENGFIGTMYDLQGQGIPLMFPIDQEQVVRALKTNSKLSKGLWGSLYDRNSALQNKLRAELSRGISQGLSYAQIAKRVSDQLGISYNNVVRIARTESHRITNEAAMDAQYKARHAGADVVKQWDATLDKRTRPHHAQLDGQIRKIDEPFEVASRTAMYPGGFGVASEDINCRCAVLQRARWALDEEELETLKERAAAFGLDKADSFEEYKEKYLQSVYEITGNAEYNIASGSGISVFDSILSKQSGMTTAYKDALNQKFVQGLGEAKKAFNKFVPSDSVADATFTGTAHFDPASRSVNMNFAADLQNMRGAGTTFFHEHGHYIDFMAAGTSNTSYLSTNSKVFGSLLRSDFRDYVNAYKKKHNMKTADAYIAISFELRGHEKHSLSDLLDGISRGKCRGMYGHRRSYWSYQGALETEAFCISNT